MTHENRNFVLYISTNCTTPSTDTTMQWTKRNGVLLTLPISHGENKQIPCSSPSNTITKPSLNVTCHLECLWASPYTLEMECPTDFRYIFNIKTRPGGQHLHNSSHPSFTINKSGYPVQEEMHCPRHLNPLLCTLPLISRHYLTWWHKIFPSYPSVTIFMPPINNFPIPFRSRYDHCTLVHVLPTIQWINSIITSTKSDLQN